MRGQVGNMQGKVEKRLSHSRLLWLEFQDGGHAKGVLWLYIAAFQKNKSFVNCKLVCCDTT